MTAKKKTEKAEKGKKKKKGKPGKKKAVKPVETDAKEPMMTAAAKTPESGIVRSAGAPEPAAPDAGKTIAPVPTGWNPRIVVFACNWCSYAGADTAGVARIPQEPHFRIIRVMCSGRVHPGFVLRAFEKGADGVLVSGCHPGDCHYVAGNEHAVKQFEKSKNVVKLLGIGEGRLRLEWISGAEGPRFAQIINEFTDQIRRLGPSPASSGAGPVEEPAAAAAGA
jgi:F420-non-reducing hydrogenase iron-sulfur subunit